MNKTLLTIIVAAAISVTTAHAKTMKLGASGKPVATIDIPDSWEPSEIENGVECQSDDDAVYLAATAVSSKKGMDAEIDDTFNMLKAHNVELNEGSKHERKFKIKGMDAEEMMFEGKDEDGPAIISITFIPVKESVVVVTYWANTDKAEKNQGAVAKIASSIKPAS